LKNRESTARSGAGAGISDNTRHMRRRRPGRLSSEILYQISLDGASELPGIGIEFPLVGHGPTLSAPSHRRLNCEEHSETIGFVLAAPARDRRRSVDGKSSHAPI
jgi:hypothetical protein